MTREELERLAGGPVHVVEEANHKDLIAFIARFFWKEGGAIILTHHAVSVALLAGVVIAAVASASTLSGVLTALGAAVILFLIPLLPLHELIHAVTYRAMGARDIRWAFSWAPLGAYVTAHGFVVNRKQFTILAFFPSVLITGGTIILALTHPEHRILFLILALLHHGGTAGDWALVNVFHHHRDRALQTMDDADLGASVFYERL